MILGLSSGFGFPGLMPVGDQFFQYLYDLDRLPIIKLWIMNGMPVVSDNIIVSSLPGTVMKYILPWFAVVGKAIRVGRQVFYVCQSKSDPLDNRKVYHFGLIAGDAIIEKRPF